MPVFGLAVVALVGAHAFDYVTFLVMVGQHGLGAELNPVVHRLAIDFGLPGLTLAKGAAVAFLAGSAVVIAPKRRSLAKLLLVFGILAGLLGGISNVASF